MKYSIETKQVTSLKGIVFNKKEDVIDAIKMFDLIPPFKVLDGGKTDVTSKFLTLLKEDGYSFVDIHQVVKKLPAKLKNVMNKNYRTSIKFNREYSLKLVAAVDVKSINGFYELWEVNCITIGTIGETPVCFNMISKSIFMAHDIKDISKSTQLAKTVEEFLSKLDV